MNELSRIIILFIALITIGSTVSKAQQILSINKLDVNKNLNGVNSISNIDAGDTVFFDLVNVSVSGNLLLVPVYIKSDDVINALDFKIKYNHNTLLFDSVQLISNCFDQTTFFESPFDSSVRFTSNSFQDYPSDTLLLNLCFDILGGTYNDSDFYNQTAFLNGITCTAHLVVPPPLSVAEFNQIPNLKLFPNPATNELFLNADRLTSVHFYDVNGKLVLYYLPKFTFNDCLIDVSKLNQGTYVVKITASDLVAVKQVVINR